MDCSNQTRDLPSGLGLIHRGVCGLRPQQLKHLLHIFLNEMGFLDKLSKIPTQNTVFEL